MDIDLNKIYGDYLLKLTISTILILKSKRFDENFNDIVNLFIQKRYPFSIKVHISVGPQLNDINYQRKENMRRILDGEGVIHKNLITVNFSEPFEDLDFQIDLYEERKWLELIGFN